MTIVESAFTKLIALSREMMMNSIVSSTKKMKKERVKQTIMKHIITKGNIYEVNEDEVNANKGLEALERLMANYYEMCLDTGCNDDQYQRYNNKDSERAIIEKELKALNIILDFCDICVYRNRLGQCFLKIGNYLSAISKENYDLLKEVLL